MEQQKKDRKDNRYTEVRPFDESRMEPKRLSDANRKEMEADQHTVGGF
ncbi:hypothetical protein LCL89_07120 [Halobacillus yeomjeoni]|uniref:Uncharacterized protein n=1 Tax=Halobacillus yeomjeoni TaxID=311194 RepID=A0A931HSX0_9BACI|nr:hypothetical protein [Halobacillus yeomjeoni]MBH0228769.1 hypothetical protein [Halobacillus yeomjeoni]MCA0983828.1 hypothetical protein [Halobacillus yeomjeoni]